MAANESTRRWSTAVYVGWGFLVLNALGTGLVALRYALPRIPFPTPLPNYSARHGFLIAHAVLSSVALLAGPWQFLGTFRKRHLNVHRLLGRIYCIAVMAGWITSLPLAAHAQTGVVASVGFLALGALWISATTAAYICIRSGRVERHREWMIRSYALTAAAITLRSYLPILLVTGTPLGIAYPMVAWLCWVPNIAFAEWLVRRRKTATQVPLIQELSA